MFGGVYTHLIPPIRPKPSGEIPPPTPVRFPQCRPQAPEPHPKSGTGAGATSGVEAGTTNVPLNTLLQGIIRPPQASMAHFSALGVHLTPDASLADLVPDDSQTPDFATWDAMPYEEARDVPTSSRPILNNGNKAPGPQTYLDRCRELSVENTAAFRAIRRVPPAPGQQPVRLGNAYEFFRNLEAMASYWDDTSAPPPSTTSTNGDDKAKAGDDAASDISATDTKTSGSTPEFSRSGAGSDMPAEYRVSALNALIKLVAYDFGCNVSAPRTEPRLYLNASPPASTTTSTTSTPSSSPPRLVSYFPTGCTFVFRSATTREASRAGLIDGPLAAVSARHTTSFSPDSPSDHEAILDLAREIIAALVTAQHRARGGRTETRVGVDAWWATKPRWGGGEGGPIGREVAHLEKMALEDKASSQVPVAESAESKPSESQESSGGAGRKKPLSSPSTSSSAPKKKKQKRTLPMYDSYRMIRPPSAAWDRRTRYEAIGKPEGTGYDDVYVVSSLFHHVSVLRVRVPEKLLAVLDGSDEEGERSWGRVEVYRSRWFDMFKAEERIEAVRILWGVMAYLMRGKDEGRKDEDVVMSGVAKGAS